MKRRMHVLTNTHWDREHRHGFQETRLMLTELLDRLMEIMEADPEFKHFILDGQVVTLDDYFEMKPGKREAIEKLVRDDRLHIGPWYTLPDMTSIAPEGIIRNLLKGYRMSESLGKVMNFGYSIFSFGQISQLPQIYSGFGIDDVIFYKGYNKDIIKKSEFWWQSPDGTRVLTSRLGKRCRWNFIWRFTIPVILGGDPEVAAEWQASFNSGRRLTHPVDPAFRLSHSIELDREVTIRREKIQQAVAECIGDVEPWTQAPEALLFFDGIDFTTPVPEITEALKQANEICADEGELFQSTPMAYFEDLRRLLDLNNLPVYEGEMRMGPVSEVHSESMSANIEILRALGPVERTLLNCAEPFLAFASILGDEYPQAALDLCWKYLFHSHAHDSVHGLGVPKIKRDTLHRLDQADELSNSLARRAFEKIVSRIDTSPLEQGDIVITAFNPTACTRNEVMELQIDLPQEDYASEWWVETLDGQRIDSYNLEEKQTSMAMVCAENRPKPVHVDRYLAQVALPQLPPFGYRTFRICRTKNPRPVIPEQFPRGEFPYDPIAKNPRLMDNGLVRIEISGDGTASLTDHETGRRLEGLLEYVDSGCRGDTWVHHMPNHDREISSAGCPVQVEVIRNTNLQSTVAMTSIMRLPVGLTADREARSEHTVDIPVRTEITLTRGSKRVDIRTSFNNTARDHFFRVRIPTGLKTNMCWTDAPFDICQREFVATNAGGILGPELERQSMLGFVDVCESGGGVALFSKTNKEFGLRCNDGTAVMELTLLRAVNGRFPIDQFVRIDYGDPAAQCLGEQVFEYAIYPHAADWKTDGIPLRCAEYLNPPVVMEFGKGNQTGQLPLEAGSMMSFERDNVLFTGMKRSEDGRKWIVRVFNPSHEVMEDALILFQKPKKVTEVRLDETPVAELEITEDGKVPFPIGGARIMTFAIEF